MFRCAALGFFAVLIALVSGLPPMPDVVAPYPDVVTPYPDVAAPGKSGDGGNKMLTCSVGRYGKLNSWTGETFNIEMPCKYRLAEFECNGMKVKVTPGNAVDENRFTPNTVWVTIKGKDDGKEWTGRTGGMWLKQAIAGTTEEPWQVKKDQLKGKVEYGLDGNASRVALQNGKLEVLFREVDTSGDKAGVTVSCREKDFENSAEYPQSMCGDGVENKSINKRKQLLYGNMDINPLHQSRATMYDVLNDDRIAQSEACNVISFIYQQDCGTQEQKLETMDVCGAIFDKRPLAKCLVSDGDIVSDFRKCLISQCQPAACGQLKSYGEANCLAAHKDLANLFTKSSDGDLSGLSCVDNGGGRR